MRRNSKCYPSRLQALAANLDHYGLRVEVKKYVNSCEHPVIQNWKERFRNVTDLEWNYYWSENWMLKMKRGRGQWTWADEPFIQFTAWYLRRDLMIVSDQSTPQHIWTRISGNIDDDKMLVPTSSGGYGQTKC